MQRTLKQNSSLHLYCKQLADELNAQGVTVQILLKNFKMDIDWTPEAVKELLWKQALKAIYKKDSTTELTTAEVSNVYEHINRFTSQVGVGLDFPSSDDGLEYISEKDM